MPVLIANWNSGQREIELRALAGLGFHPYAAALTFNNSFTDGKADARTRDFFPMQTFKYAKYLLMIFRRNTHAVVGDFKAPLTVKHPGRDVNGGRRRAAVLDGVPDKILENLNEMNFRAADAGQGINADRSAAIPNGGLQVFKHFLKHAAEVDRIG